MIGTIVQKRQTGRTIIGSRPFKKLLTWLVTTDAAYRERAKLATMSDTQLADIGLSRSDAQRIAGKLDWDAPIQFY